MPKRFTATEKWVDPWFCELDNMNKLFWLFVLDNCDHAGVWQVNWSLVNFHLKGTFLFDPKIYGDRIIPISSERWIITKFISFQYNHFNPKNRVHQSVISRLANYGVCFDIPGFTKKKIKDLARTMLGHKEYNNENDQDNDPSLPAEPKSSSVARLRN